MHNNRVRQKERDLARDGERLVECERDGARDIDTQIIVLPPMMKMISPDEHDGDQLHWRLVGISIVASLLIIGRFVL